MHRIKSMLLTLLCTGIILGAGYIVIVESGRQVLERESTLEEAKYESTSSNIFYGKIEEDIELFPWNYYPGDDAAKKTGSYPMFWEDGIETIADNIFWEAGTQITDNISLEDAEETEEKKRDYTQNWYISQLIAYESDTEVEDVWDWYEENQKNVIESMVVVEESPVGFIYFYQDILELKGKQYQVRLACSDWNILSFICVEYNPGSKSRREGREWEKGKERLVTILEQSEDQMMDYFTYMTDLQDLSLTSVYMNGNEYVNACLQSFYWLEDILVRGQDVAWLEERKAAKEALASIYGKEEHMKEKMGDETQDSAKKNTEVDVYDNVSYSYQIVELKDMILLLMQGETTLGIYYDPVNQKFCGYNYFYEN